jgi:hypothetical protein
MTRLIFNILFILILAGSMSAQQADVASLKESTSRAQSGLGINPAGNPFSLLDISRINWSHSYSVAFFSGGGSSGSIGMLNTTMNYEISSKLHLAVNLGLMHNPGSLWNRNADSQATLLPGFRLDFRPSENVWMSLSVQKVAGYSPYSSSRYGRY